MDCYFDYYQKRVLYIYHNNLVLIIVGFILTRTFLISIKTKKSYVHSTETENFPLGQMICLSTFQNMIHKTGFLFLRNLSFKSWKWEEAQCQKKEMMFVYLSLLAKMLYEQRKLFMFIRLIPGTRACTILVDSISNEETKFIG